MDRKGRRILQITVTVLGSVIISATVLGQELDPENPMLKDLLELDLATLMTIEITPSADASASGLSTPDLGGQIASGSRVGILGSKPTATSPFSITSYTQRYIEDQQAASVGNVLQYDPTVRVARGFGNFQQLYKVRGLPIFSDDMAYNGLYGILPRQYLATELVERLEILRGANAFLNGAAPSDSGLGGAVNVMPKRAPLQPLTRVSAGLQTDSQTHIATDLARRSDNGRSGIRVNAIQRKGDASMNGESRELTLVSTGLDYTGTQLRLSADLGYQQQQLTGTQPSITIGSGLAIPGAPNPSHSIAPDWTYSNATDWFGTLRAELDLTNDLTAWLAVGARESEEQARLAAFLTVADDVGNYSASRFDNVREDSINTGELGLRYRFITGNVKHQLSVATTRFGNHARNAYDLYSTFQGNIYQANDTELPTTLTFAGGDLNQPLTTQITHTSSSVVADELSLLNDRLLLTLGARYQELHEKPYDYVSGELTQHYDGNQTTPVAALVYQVHWALSVYANYIEGLSKGGEAPTTNTNGPVANAGVQLPPQQVKQLETGIKFTGKLLGGSLSLFQLEKPILGFTGNNLFTEVQTQRHRGIEGLMFGNITPNLKLLAGLSLLDTDIDGKHSIGAPEQIANLNLDWNLPGLHGLALQNHWMYNGDQFADADNTQRVPSWWRWDLGLRYETQWWQQTRSTLRIRVENLTNEHYWASAGGYPGAGYLTLGEPRTLLGSMTIDF